MSEEGLVAAVVVSIIVAIGMLVLEVRQVSHHLDASKCPTFSVETGFETKFVDYHFWDWDCLAKTKEGRWVSTEKLREVD